MRPNQQGKLEIDLYGDLAGILTLAGKKARPLDQDDLSVQQVKVVAGVRFETYDLQVLSLRANWRLREMLPICSLGKNDRFRHKIIF